jgi:hypothetical protein
VRLSYVFLNPLRLPESGRGGVGGNAREIVTHIDQRSCGTLCRTRQAGDIVGGFALHFKVEFRERPLVVTDRGSPESEWDRTGANATWNLIDGLFAVAGLVQSSGSPWQQDESAEIPDILTRLQIDADAWKATLEKLLGGAKNIGNYFGGTPRLNEVAANRDAKSLKNVSGRSMQLTTRSAGRCPILRCIVFEVHRHTRFSQARRESSRPILQAGRSRPLAAESSHSELPPTDHFPNRLARRDIIRPLAASNSAECETRFPQCIYNTCLVVFLAMVELKRLNFAIRQCMFEFFYSEPRYLGFVEQKTAQRPAVLKVL